MKKALILLTATAIFIPGLALAQYNGDQDDQIRNQELQVKRDRSQVRSDEQVRDQDLRGGNKTGAYAEQREIRRDRDQIHGDNHQIIDEEHDMRGNEHHVRHHHRHLMNENGMRDYDHDRDRDRDNDNR